LKSALRGVHDNIDDIATNVTNELDELVSFSAFGDFGFHKPGQNLDREFLLGRTGLLEVVLHDLQHLRDQRSDRLKIQSLNI
jgi:hypothetical protein